MEATIEFPGLEGRRLVLRASGMFSKAKLFLDGQPAPRGSKRGQFVLRRNDGSQVIAQLKATNLVSPYPQLIIDGQVVPVGEPFKWYQWIWAGLPLALIFVGGFIGAIFGALGAFLNGRILYTDRSQPMKFLLNGIITLAAAAAYWFAGVNFVQAVPDLFAGDPQEFTTQSGEFSVMTPVQLQETVETVPTQGSGQVDIHLFSAETRKAAYMIAYSDYPQNAFAGVDPQLVLANSRDGAVANSNGALASDEEISLQGYPGRQLLIEGVDEQGQKMAVHSRMYLVGDRLFQVMVILPEGQTMSADMEGFLTSFKLLNP